MVDLYEGPSREGVRGGLEQFSWDVIKSQVFKDRECYLGQSVQVGIQGKFGRFFRNDWWFLDRKTPQNIDEEQKFYKRFEEELMQEALNLKPKRLLLLKSELTTEQKDLLKREFAETDKINRKLRKKEKRRKKKQLLRDTDIHDNSGRKYDRKVSKGKNMSRSSLERF